MIFAVRVNIGSVNPVKIDAVKRVFIRVFPESEIIYSSGVVETGVPEQPFNADVTRGAVTRAKAALGDADFGVGIEAGLIWQEQLQMYFDVQFCAVIDSGGRITAGHGSGFTYPARVITDVLAGMTVSQAMMELTGIKNIGHHMGAVGYLSNGLLNRTILTEQAVLMALIPRIRAEHFE